MKDHFITEIQIKDFKCFDDFKADGFTQVNLIGGKNNVGKTAFMEACYINLSAQDVKSFSYALYDIKFRREKLNLLYNEVNKKEYIEESHNIFTKSNINKAHYSIDEENGIKVYHFEMVNSEHPDIFVNVNEFSFEFYNIDNINYIDNFGFSNANIVTGYASIQKRDEENYLNKILKLVDPNIESFKIIEDKPQCKVSGNYLNITELGDGVRHTVSILTSLYSSENGYLFIDEIDNGIHFSILDTIWKTILTLSKELNVQVFATTHSKECIESFNHAQLKISNTPSSYFEMVRGSKTGKLSMRALDSDQLDYELKHQGRYRGE